MTFIKVMAALSLRFTSGNSIPIESARITKEEWYVIQNTFEEMIARGERAEKLIYELECEIQSLHEDYAGEDI